MLCLQYLLDRPRHEAELLKELCCQLVIPAMRNESVGERAGVEGQIKRVHTATAAASKRAKATSMIGFSGFVAPRSCFFFESEAL